jgi:DNA invertase Pin-like site-specific DNA recombinase
LRRCAVYTRKSSDEGLEQEFNSLDAQREACEAYIRSQAGEGWKPHHARYDDGGYSGGSMDRPGLAQLLDDIRSRRLDTVVVYKVDRLTRSLADFAKIVEVFDSHGVSFVSVTQQFNTTTSMGRLTLNMLLSFAQFEREVTGERIRDKIAASKRKGMWMGGYVPLGYEASGRTLTIHEEEAETVRTVFGLYLELGTVRRVKEEVDRRGMTTKLRLGAGGRMRGGQPFSRGHLYHLLSNPLYVGRIAHNGETFEGQHPAIIDRETWDGVQKRLADNAVDRPARARVTEPSPLRGKLFDEDGVPLTPSHAVKAGRRYRYYVSRETVARPDDGAPAAPGRLRLPAHEIERLVEDAVAALLRDTASLARCAREAGIDAERIPELLNAVRGSDARSPLKLVKRVELDPERIALQIDLSHLLDGKEAVVRHAISTRIRRRGVELRLVLEGAPTRASDRRPDPALIKAVARAKGWFEDLVNGRARSYEEIARREGITPRYVAHLMPLAFLAPEIVETILEGTQSIHLTAQALTKRIELPMSWVDQRRLLRFD